MMTPNLERSLRIGAVSYLNTKPLVHELKRLAPRAKLSFDLPSRLADQLSQGKLDVALIPSVEFLQDPDYVQVSDACIGCIGPVLSVKLYSKVPPNEIRTLALDEGSRTSAAMVQVWLADRFGVRPDLCALPIGDGLRDACTDAVLLIGDRAIGTQSATYPLEWDMGEHWIRDYKAPFVFAVWTARRGMELGQLSTALSQARDSGLAHLPEIAAQECRHVNMTESDCLAYLRDNLYFRFGEEQARGLQLFRDLTAEYGLLSRVTP
jgi:chorismate dehydratase